MERDRDDLVRWACAEAMKHMTALGCRRTHVQRVAHLASEASRVFPSQAELFVAAAWLHDIGYAAPLAHSGFHPLDGARWLRAQGHDELASLVAHHSGARYEAALRGIDDYLDEFPFQGSELDLALTYCDLTTGPDGRRLTLERRIAEIHERYGYDHVVARAMRLGWSEFAEARTRTEQLMDEAGVELSGSLAYPESGSR